MGGMQKIMGPLSLVGGVAATAMGQPEIGIPLIMSGAGGTIGELAGGSKGATLGELAGGAVGGIGEGFGGLGPLSGLQSTGIGQSLTNSAIGQKLGSLLGYGSGGPPLDPQELAMGVGDPNSILSQAPTKPMDTWHDTIASAVKSPMASTVAGKALDAMTPQQQPQQQPPQMRQPPAPVSPTAFTFPPTVTQVPRSNLPQQPVQMSAPQQAATLNPQVQQILAMLGGGMVA